MKTWRARVLDELHYLVIERPDLNSHGHRRRLGRLRTLLREGDAMEYTNTTNHEEQ